MFKEFLELEKVQSSLLELKGVDGARYGEVVAVTVEGKRPMVGRVIKIDDNRVVVQVFGDTIGVGVQNTRIRFEGRPFEIPLSKEVLGRTFNGIGDPIDKRGPVFSDAFYNVNGRPLNPVSREYPRNFIQTGISTIDGLATLIRGQKLPIFTGSGLPHNQLAAQIVRQARIQEGEGAGDFAIVFAAIGVKHDEAFYFEQEFKKAGVTDHVVMYINYADDPIMERIITPKCALTAAEYLAFEQNYHVLVIMTDITSYGEALREVSSLREEVPSRKGYPGYLYSDLAAIYERAGTIKDIDGSITLIPILTMPNDDITHPIPDLTGYITEGQIVLSRDLHSQEIAPPINILPSLSRLMKDGIGEGYTREDHPAIADQLFSAYSRVQDIRALAQIIGEEDLPERDQKYLEFGKAFEERYVNQDFFDNRSILETLNLGWEIARLLPEEGLDRLKPELKEKYLRKV